MCVHRRATLRARTWPPFLLFHTAFISLVTLECFFFFFFPFSVHFHLSPDEHFPRFKQCLLCCGRRRGGVRFISVSSPRELCPSRPPCFILLPTELIKINMVLFAYIRLACNLADGGAPRGTAAACIWICFRKMPGKKPQAQRAHTHVGAQGHGSVFSREAKKKKRRNQAPFKGEVGGTSLLLPQIQGTRVGWA